MKIKELLLRAIARKIMLWQKGDDRHHLPRESAITVNRERFLCESWQLAEAKTQLGTLPPEAGTLV
jgi:hypothetical protein